MQRKDHRNLLVRKCKIDNTPSFLKQAVEDSLKRMKTDYIDLFYIHYPDGVTPGYEAVGALKELKDRREN